MGYYDVESVIYWAVNVPVSIVGIVGNIIVIWTWLGKRYKFNRWLIMNLDACHCVFLVTYHVSRNLEIMNGIVILCFLFILYTVRLHAVLLQIFLSGLQYLWSLNTNSRRFKRPILSKKGTTRGRNIVFFCSVLLTLVYIVVQNKLSGPHQKLFSAASHIVALAVPQILNVRFVVGMIVNTRRRQHSAKVALQSVNLTKECGQSGPPSVQQSICHSVQLSRRLSAGAQVSPGSLSSDTELTGASQFSTRTCQALLMRNMVQEARMTNAIVVISISEIFVYLFLILVQICFALDEDEWMYYYLAFRTVEFSNCSFHLFLFLALLPSFRQSLKERWSHLWNKEQAKEKEKTSGSGSHSVNQTCELATTSQTEACSYLYRSSRFVSTDLIADSTGSGSSKRK